MTDWKWTKPRTQAALAVAEDRLTDEKISQTVGINIATLYDWKRIPEFQERVKEHVAEFAAIIRSQGIGRLENRVRRLDEDWRRMQDVREARADEHAGIRAARNAYIEASVRQGASLEQAARLADKEFPVLLAGGDTGLVVRTVKLDRFGGRIEESQVDTGLLAELRAHEAQASKELGQMVERSEVGGAGGGPMRIQFYLPDNGRGDTLPET